MLSYDHPPDGLGTGTLVAVRTSIADYEVVEPWNGADGRFVCRPPGRLRRHGEVMVSELAVDAEGWQQLCDTLLRMALAPGARMLEVLEVGPDPATGGVFVVTEAAPGGSLSRPAKALPRDARIAAVEAAARGAHALHEVGLAHGSIQPGSVVMTGGGAALDLPHLDASPGEVIRVDGWEALVAVDPEVLAGESPARSSDIWSLGVTLHSVLSDKPLFPGIEADEPVTAVQRVMFTRPQPDQSLPSELLALVTDCLAADAADRPATALAVADRLGREVQA